MTTESRRLPASREPSAEDFRAFFDLVELPAALCDPQLRLRVANPAFTRFCFDHGLTVGQMMESIAHEPVPDDWGSREVEVELPQGGVAVLELTRRDDSVSVVGRRESEHMRGHLVVVEQALLEQARTEGVLLDLGRSVAEAGSEEELVAAVARGVKELFPGRSFCIRITDARTGVLTSLYAEGRLKEGSREPLVIKRSAAEKLHLNAANLPAGRVVVASRVPLLFEGSVEGGSAPLVASGQLYGAINLEYPAPGRLEVNHSQDERVLVQLANQVAVAVKNAKLIDELTFVRKYLEDLLEMANALIVVANREGKIVVFNQAISRLTGFHKEEVLGRDVAFVVHREEHLRMAPVLSAALRGESLANFELRLRTRTGQEALVSFATSISLTSQGEVEGVMAIGQDVTQVAQLEQRVIHAEKLASLGQLAASVAHEINNPMTAVVTYADAMLQRMVPVGGTASGDAEKLRKILENGQRILRFTRDLTSYARPSKNKPERVRLAALLDKAVGFCEHVVSQAKVTVARDYGEVPPLSAVAANLEQVFVNLITNACHATGPGGQVRLRTRCEGREAVVWVEDTGSGIETEHLSRIFEPFFTTKTEGKGTGLGLSIVQRIVEKHGGRIDVHSTPGQGTTFTVRLPLSD